MKVVGVGCGPGLLTEAAIRVLKGARLVYGSRRAIEIARGALPRSCEIHEIRDYSSLDIPDDAVLLSTGDPMLAGLGDRGGEVIPGISSLQLAFARLRLPLVKVAIVDGHGRNPALGIAETLAEVARGKIVFLLPDPGFPLGDLAQALMEGGGSCPEGPRSPPDDPGSVSRGPNPSGQEEPLRASSSLRDPGSCTIALCEDLGYPAERITRGTTENPPEIRSRLFSLVIGRF
jgi:cobalt-precorrin-7 (C5)-methyltransferase